MYNFGNLQIACTIIKNSKKVKDDWKVVDNGKSLLQFYFSVFAQSSPKKNNAENSQVLSGLRFLVGDHSKC